MNVQLRTPRNVLTTADMSTTTHTKWKRQGTKNYDRKGKEIMNHEQSKTDNRGT